MALLSAAAAAALLLQWAAKLLLSAAGCTSCSAAAAVSLRMLQNLGRTIVCSAVLPSPQLELTTTPLALANQQLSLLGKTCLTRPCQDRVEASLSIVQTLISSSEEDLRQTGRIHPNSPCPPIAVLQPLLQGPTSYNWVLCCIELVFLFAMYAIFALFASWFLHCLLHGFCIVCVMVFALFASWFLHCLLHGFCIVGFMIFAMYAS